MPRSLTVLSVCAVAAWDERPAARARVKTRDARFMAKPFKDRPGKLACRRVRRWATSWSTAANASLTAVAASPVKRWIEGRKLRPSTCGDLNSPAHHRTTGAPGQGVDDRL